MTNQLIKINKSYLDYKKYTNYTYIEVLLSLNIKIPHLCYHNQLPVSGNCRLCLGIIGADKKPSPLCATSVRPNDIVDYNSSKVRRLREDVLEFLLINHPMDCPSCDQGGECDLQDYNYNYGSDRSRYSFSYKKAILNKDRGILIKTVMNRCINCTRCTRFFAEVVGTSLVGIIGRGIKSEISSYVETKFSDCEFSGNVIDLCPVGALTSLPNTFVNRIWNLQHIPAFDALDSLGSFITLHYNGSKIIKVTPRINYNLNLNWISDKIRYIFDGLYKQRILRPLYRLNNNTNDLIDISWDEVFSMLKRDLIFTNNNINIGCYFGELLNNNIIYTLSKYMDIIGNSNKFSITNSFYINNDLNSNYLFNSKIISINTTDTCIMFGSNLKTELPILNIRLRKQYLANALPIINFGSKINLMYPVYQAGFSIKSIIKFINGTSCLCKLLHNKLNPIFLMNINMFKNETIYNFFEKCKLDLIHTFKNITKKNFNYIHTNIDVYNKLFLNIQTKYKDNFSLLNCLYLINPDNNLSSFINFQQLSDLYIIYQGHHANNIYMNLAKIILPSKFYLNETGSFINLEGDILTNDIIIYDNDSDLYVKNNLLIIYSIFTTLFEKLIFSFQTVFKKHEIYNENPILAISNYSIKDNLTLYNNIKLKNNYIKNYTLNSTLYNFYQNDSISLSSKLMFDCANTLVKKSNY